MILQVYRTFYNKRSLYSYSMIAQYIFPLEHINIQQIWLLLFAVVSFDNHLFSPSLSNENHICYISIMHDEKIFHDCQTTINF